MDTEKIIGIIIGGLTVCTAIWKAAEALTVHKINKRQQEIIDKLLDLLKKDK